MDSRSLANQQKEEFAKLVEFFEKDYGDPWYVLVRWSEPNEKMIWTKYDAYGPLNDSFLSWVNNHWDYWQDKAACGIGVQEIHRFPKKEINRTW